ncbi:hypothetical protein MWU75_10530 [Ornithinimicrobium sp. F0845]|uniref:glycoside hydrolase family 3 protein n=1 Tax=Ornithinimicrobium sp. F0845 TaxID=2926412 RepID=UPI001FF39B21|nr:glycoside hydrolase family 3 N-terminal domain-containing protein [Ornithinimicrobium sp. F0845]MCK0112575.1 hypothetical protein [Ornithinimicrobium sp. F0845]
MTELQYAARSVLLAGFAGPVVPSWLPREVGLGLGGVCLYGNNVAPGHDLAALARSLRELAPTAVLAIDEEGGDVTRLHTTTGSPYAGAAVLGRLDDLEVTRQVAAGIGAELAAAGIWLDLAPCADVNSDPLNPVIGTRSFGADPALVARHTEAFVRGLASAGVAASVKHFPGHGDTRTDSHHGLPTVRAAEDVVRQRELVPFAAAVAAGTPTVMTSHVVIEAIDPLRPATFSPVVLGDLLRDELGFDGVIVTDALDMAGAQGTGPDAIGIPGAAVRSLAAGADLLCLGPETTTDGAVVIEQVVEAILAAVDDGTLPAARLLDAAERVARLREEWAVTPAAVAADGATGLADPADPHSVTRVARAASLRAATAALSNVPVLPGPAVVHVDTASNPAVGETAWGLPCGSLPGLRSSVRLVPKDLARTSPPTGPSLIVVRGATRDERVWEWICGAVRGNNQTWLVELGWPDPWLSALDRVVCTYGASAASTEALAKALTHASGMPSGSLPRRGS